MPVQNPRGRKQVMEYLTDGIRCPAYIDLCYFYPEWTKERGRIYCALAAEHDGPHQQARTLRHDSLANRRNVETVQAYRHDVQINVVWEEHFGPISVDEFITRKGIFPAPELSERPHLGYERPQITQDVSAQVGPALPEPALALDPSPPG